MYEPTPEELLQMEQEQQEGNQFNIVLNVIFINRSHFNIEFSIILANQLIQDGQG